MGHQPEAVARELAVRDEVSDGRREESVDRSTEGGWPESPSCGLLSLVGAAGFFFLLSSQPHQ